MDNPLVVKLVVVVVSSKFRVTQGCCKISFMVARCATSTTNIRVIRFAQSADTLRGTLNWPITISTTLRNGN